MANCSIPSSTPAIGRISTPLSRRSRKQNNAASIPQQTIAPPPLGFFNAQRSTLNAQYLIQSVGRWMLDVGRWAFFSWRVKGAWWSSRSSKPLSAPHTRGRGRFDSYPLRHSVFDFRFAIFDCARSSRVIFFVHKLKFENQKSGKEVIPNAT
jgi:hypothetical protein